jgi:hypothetical protein
VDISIRRRHPMAQLCRNPLSSSRPWPWPRWWPASWCTRCGRSSEGVRSAVAASRCDRARQPTSIPAPAPGTGRLSAISRCRRGRRPMTRIVDVLQALVGCFHRLIPAYAANGGDRHSTQTNTWARVRNTLERVESRYSVRIANLSGRLALVTDAGAIDVESASAGRFSSDAQRVYERWFEFVEWAEKTPAGSGVRNRRQLPRSRGRRRVGGARVANGFHKVCVVVHRSGW